MLNNNRDERRKTKSLYTRISLFVFILSLILVVVKATGDFTSGTEAISINIIDDNVVAATLDKPQFWDVLNYSWEVRYYCDGSLIETQTLPDKKLSLNLELPDAIPFDAIKFIAHTDSNIIPVQFCSTEYKLPSGQNQFDQQSSEQMQLAQQPNQQQNQQERYQLACFASDTPYTYDLLVKDIEQTLQSYNDIATYDVIGKSVDGKDIYAIKVGHGAAHVLITAGVHARENANTPLIMQCLFDFLYNIGHDKDIFNRVTLIIVPLVNPDGYQYCIDNGNGRKKTNINDVDINRNFPCKYWGSRKKSGGNGYPGPFAGSEPETKAVMALFDQYTFSLAVDIHSRGRQIICKKGGYTAEDIATRQDPDELNSLSRSITQDLLEDIRYDMIKERSVIKGEEGTLTDYAFSCGVPTITFETLKYRKYRLASPAEIRNEYEYFDWTKALKKIAEFTDTKNQ